jgi:hypothetical protein
MKMNKMYNNHLALINTGNIYEFKVLIKIEYTVLQKSLKKNTGPRLMKKTIVHSGLVLKQLLNPTIVAHTLGYKHFNFFLMMLYALI